MAMIKKTRLKVSPGSNTPFLEEYEESVEGEANAQSTGTETGEGSVGEGLEGEPEGRLHLRNDAQDGLDTGASEGSSGNAEQETLNFESTKLKEEQVDPLEQTVDTSVGKLRKRKK